MGVSRLTFIYVVTFFIRVQPFLNIKMSHLSGTYYSAQVYAPTNIFLIVIFRWDIELTLPLFGNASVMYQAQVVMG